MIVVDPHVHVYGGFDRAVLLRSAVANLAAGERKLQLPTAERCVILTEMAGDRIFREWADAAPVAIAEWTIERGGDETSLVASSREHGRLRIFAGRQIVTSERLEVAALLIDTDALPDGGTTADTVRRVIDLGGVPLMPLGVGKWTGARGRVIDAVLATDWGRPLYVGDNGGRVVGSPMPRRLREAVARGRWNLPGSDPLPLPGQERRAGRCGFVLDAALDPDRPAASLRAALDALRAQPRTFFRGEPPHRFFRAQVAMQLRKRSAA